MSPIQAENRSRVGVVLFQLGGPDSLEAVEPFLYNLFCDPDIIDWLGPSLHQALQTLASNRSERVLVVPISFVSDHLETLHEINIEARELAERLCIRRFHATKGLNDSPKFIQALADLVLYALAGEDPQ